MYRRAIISIHLIAINAAIFRLVQRYRTKQYYWDDLWAACTLISDLGLLVTACIWPMNPGIPGLSIDPETRVARIWVTGHLLPCVDWTSRIGIAFSIYRIAESDVLRKRCTIALICVSLLSWTSIIVVKSVTCSEKKMLQRESAGVDPLCLTRSTRLCFTGLCVVCDACLVFIPLHMLRSLRLPKTDRYLIRLVFGASILSSIAIVVDTTCVMTYFPKTSGLATIELTAQLKAAVALLVCNLIVVIPCIYRLFRNEAQCASIPISIHIDVSSARTSIPDRLISPPSQAGHAVIREQRSQGRVLGQLISRVPGGEPLSEPLPLLDLPMYEDAQ